MQKAKITPRKRDGIYTIDYYIDGKRKQKTLKTRDYNEAVSIAMAEYGYSPHMPTVSITEPTPKMDYIKAVDKYIMAEYDRPDAWKKGFPVGIHGTGNASEGACSLGVLRFLYDMNPGLNYVCEINYTMLQDFIDHNKRRELSNNTLNKYRNRIRKFLHFCYINDWVQKNEGDKLRVLKKNKVNRYHFSTTDLNKIFKSPESKKFRTFYKFMLETGLRACDTWDLTQDNFEVRNDGYMYMVVNMVKVDKPLDVPISKAARAIVESSGRRLFPWYNSNTVTEPLAALKRSFGVLGSAGSKYVKKHGISLHTFRHTFSMNLLDKGVSKENIQQLLGHTSVTTTEIYANFKDPSKLTEFIGG